MLLIDPKINKTNSNPRKTKKIFELVGFKIFNKLKLIM